MRLLVTGGSGFIGANFIRYLLQERDDVQIVNLDLLTYAGNLETLFDVAHDPRYRFVRGDIAQTQQVKSALEPGMDAIINFAAETHVDRSILDSSAFIRSNVQGTQVLLEAARTQKIPRFIQISTDEVYGSASDGSEFTEESPLAPSSPYAASKAAADLLACSYHKTYGLNIIITRCTNNYGPYQFPEKFIPLMILNTLQEKSLPVYGDGKHIRDWIHVRDYCRALELVLTHGQPGRIYNVAGSQPKQNLDVVHQILDVLQKSPQLIQLIRDRPAHDRRYAIDAGRIQQEMGWSPKITFDEGLQETIEWYQQNESWLEHVCSGAYRDYYRQMYEDRDQTLASL